MKRKIIFSIIIVVILIAAIFFSYKTQKTQSRELIYALPDDVITLDPIKNPNIYNGQVISQIYEGIVKLDENNQIVPALAESWTTEDFKVWKFKIRKNVLFHDGTKLNLRDVLFSFQRILSKDSNHAWLFAGLVKDMRIEEPDTFIIELNKPEKYFLSRITANWIAVVPEKIKDIPNFGTEIAIGTGPFKLIKKTDTEITLIRNENYWGKTKGNVSTIKFVVIKNDQVRLSELKSGKVNIMELPLSLSQNLRDLNDLKISNFPTFNVHFIGFNSKELDQHLRRAINFAINRKEIQEAATANLGAINSTPLPTTFKDVKEEDVFNLDEAKKEISLVKSIPKLELMVSDKNNAPIIAEIVQNQLKKINLDISIKQVEFNTLIDNIIKGQTNFFIAWFSYMFSSPEPILFDVLHSSKIPAPNFWKFEDKEMNKMLEKLSEPNTENLIPQIISKFQSNPPFVPLFTLKTALIHSKFVKNVYMNGHSIPLLEEIIIEK